MQPAVAAAHGLAGGLKFRAGRGAVLRHSHRDMSFQRRAEVFLFFVALLSFGWFNQGGGWNQNARFAEVRAIVDGGELRLTITSATSAMAGRSLRRYPVVNGDVTIGGKTSRLCWVGRRGNLTPINGVEPPENMDGVAIDDLAARGMFPFQGPFSSEQAAGAQLRGGAGVLCHFAFGAADAPEPGYLVAAECECVADVGVQRGADFGGGRGTCVSHRAPALSGEDDSGRHSGRRWRSGSGRCFFRLRRCFSITT